MTARRVLPPGLRPPASKPASPDGLLRVVRRYAETEAVRAIAAVFAVVAVAILALLAWLWLFGR
jgi:hypothetical protein